MEELTEEQRAKIALEMLNDWSGYINQDYRKYLKKKISPKDDLFEDFREFVSKIVMDGKSASEEYYPVFLDIFTPHFLKPLDELIEHFTPIDEASKRSYRYNAIDVINSLKAMRAQWESRLKGEE